MRVKRQGKRTQLAADGLANHFAPALRLLGSEHGEGPFHWAGTVRLARFVPRVGDHCAGSHLPYLADQELFLDRPDLFALAGREPESVDHLWLTEGTHAL